MDFRKKCFIATVGFLFLYCLSTGLQALCLTPPEEGTWINTNVNTNSIPKVVIRFNCQDQIRNGQPYPPGDPYYVRVFGKCHPTNCNWGEKGATRLESTGQIYAYYNMGYAKRYVYAKMSAYRQGQLWVYVYTDFTDRNRRDYGVHNWFKKELYL